MNTQGFENFLVDFGKDSVVDLHRRIKAARWPDAPFDTGWSVGTNDAVLRDLASYWASSYDWLQVQDRLNELAHFRGSVGGEQLHFVIHKAGGVERGLPLLLLHGWPGSFVEFERAKPLLTERGFDLVVPSLPGFVFSDAPSAAGVNPTRIAERMHLLMQSLGCNRYGVQGGDWGCIIAREMGRLYPEAVTGIHINCAPWLPDLQGRTLTAQEERYLAFRKKFDATETGYWSIQATKPQSLAYGLQDSPVGLLAWVLEKFWAWSDHDSNDLWRTFDRNDVLTNVTLYWLTGRVLSSARIYHEAASWWPGDLSRVSVPTGYARFPKEPWGPPASLIESFFNLIHRSEMPRGGHFAALEQPEIYAEDVAKFFERL